jgi:CBS domain-containing protein
MDTSRLNRFINQPLRDFTLEEPVFVETSDSARTAVERMREGSRSCVLIRERGAVVGIFTERDVLTHCMADRFDWSRPLGDDLFTRNPRTIASNATLGEALAIFQQHRYRTLPVLEDQDVIGLIRIGDVLTGIAEVYPEEVLNLPPRPHQVMEKPEGG